MGQKIWKISNFLLLERSKFGQMRTLICLKDKKLCHISFKVNLESLEHPLDLIENFKAWKSFSGFSVKIKPLLWSAMCKSLRWKTDTLFKTEISCFLDRSWSVRRQIYMRQWITLTTKTWPWQMKKRYQDFKMIVNRWERKSESAKDDWNLLKHILIFQNITR